MLLVRTVEGNMYQLTNSCLPFSFGAAFTSFYRLVGPFKSDTSPRVIKTEIWDTISRRGILGNLIMGLIPMVFYTWINLFAYGLEKLLYFLEGATTLPARLL
jgi:dimethylaniline monooxygenase (N-oxide forming)